MSDLGPLFVGTSEARVALTPELAGSKAAQLWQMSRMGLNVPPAFVLPTTLCALVNRGERDAIAALDRGLREGIAGLEAATGRRLGDERVPLLVSVRSGAAQSMPGMLATILDVGLNDATVRGLIGMTGNPRLAWDSYRRFVQIYSAIVHNATAMPFETALARLLETEKAADESDLDSEALERLTTKYLLIAACTIGHPVPADPIEQLQCAARAVFGSWEAARAREYRRLNGLEHLTGTAVTVQAMVFGNAGSRSGSGVAFTRNPATGANELYVDFLFDAQGEDVVAGRRIPGNIALLAARLPTVADELRKGAARLERELRDVQDIEFTLEDGKLYFLQTRSAKLTPRAGLKILVDLVREGVLSPAEALERVDRIDLNRTRITRFLDAAAPVATATSAAPGVASGRIAFDPVRAKVLAAAGEPVILVRHDTSTEDVAGFAVAAGILTAVGGRTAHAAVVARQLGNVCLVGCRGLKIYDGARSGEIAGTPIGEGDWISLDGNTGAVTLGRREIIAEMPAAELCEIEAWRQHPPAPPSASSA